jgi:hypothetical protein
VITPSASALAATTGIGPDVAHIYCCDENWSWCGVDISGDSLCLDDDCCPACPLCLLAEPGLGCCGSETPR